MTKPSTNTTRTIAAVGTVADTPCTRSGSDATTSRHQTARSETTRRKKRACWLRHKNVTHRYQCYGETDARRLGEIDPHLSHTESFIPLVHRTHSVRCTRTLTHPPSIDCAPQSREENKRNSVNSRHVQPATTAAIARSNTHVRGMQKPHRQNHVGKKTELEKQPIDLAKARKNPKTQARKNGRTSSHNHGNDIATVRT
jgi:hypothetical protein